MRVETTDKAIKAYDVETATQAEVDALFIEADVTGRALFLHYDSHVRFRASGLGCDMEMSKEKFQPGYGRTFMHSVSRKQNPSFVTHDVVMPPLGAKPRRLFKP
ncbi:hypothetical protein [Rhizobium laguerreae]|uniref:hypothetical protein n=1 Tax=Rhizobium laguerreae TaxID=1076926 RepID=UPI001C92161B|nr:hypothetical protein [Rhizobium laguerreae]MBY3314719.1 hypothetical protein [Rhizobium laguerreae]